MKSFVEKNRESSSSKRKPNTNATPLKSYPMKFSLEDLNLYLRQFSKSKAYFQNFFRFEQN